MRRYVFGTALMVSLLACGLGLWAQEQGAAGSQAGPPPAPPDLLADAPRKVTIPGLAPRNELADTVHLVLGIATVVTGGLTGLTAPDDDGGGGFSLHHALGWTTAGLAAGTLASGAWAHWGDLDVSMGFSPPNVHALLGIAGGLLMIAAPIVAPAGGGDGGGELHAALGAGGGLLMVIAIIVPLVLKPAPAPAP